ncbi:protein LYRIC [Microcaecilia unicolor]|uniref:Protein LYRIC n=1 Tax=Microcaecilia unicolor TaxID=1415580 RepID=A0A6P7WWW5_9AMPH|nr:protein LYRIC [Microcaecilia unicolor]
MAAGWQDELAVQAKAVAARMRELLGSGLGLLQNELGLDLGLDPQRLSAWLLFLMPVLCLLGLAMFWAAACSGRKRSRAAPGEEEEEEAVATADKAMKSPKADELRKKPKKKIMEKIKQQPNGRPHLDLSEEEILSVNRKEILKQSLDAEKKNEKSKKSKKGQMQYSRGEDTSEVWIFHKEDLQELISLVYSMLHFEDEQLEVPVTTPWSTVDGRMNAPEQTSASFASLGLNPSVSGTVSETVSQTSTSDIQWDISCNPPHIDDEWSGPNGLDSADPGSDWNAPVEAWGNWVEEETTACPQPEEPISDVQKVSEDEKERESALQSSTSSKSKKKKKKKKKQIEETSSPMQDPEDVDREVGDDVQEDNSHVQTQQEIIFPMKTISTSEPAEPEEEEPTLAVFTEPSVKVLSIPEQISSQVPQMLQETDVSHSNKQNSVPPSSQIKSEESWESPKQIKKKKKARRET